MDQDGAWGTHVELTLISHMLSINVATFVVEEGRYGMYTPGIICPDEFGEDHSRTAIYMHYTGNHYNVVLSQE